MPTTPLSGVRISWLMLARNSLLARLAASAISLRHSKIRFRLLPAGNVDGHGSDQQFSVRPLKRKSESQPVMENPIRGGDRFFELHQVFCRKDFLVMKPNLPSDFRGNPGGQSFPFHVFEI